jgi:hypothetical protein
MKRLTATLLASLALTLGGASPALAGHEHFLITPGICVEDIARGQTSQTSGGGFHQFHENVHIGTPGTFAMTQPNNPVQIYKVDQAGAPSSNCP